MPQYTSNNISPNPLLDQLPLPRKQAAFEDIMDDADVEMGDVNCTSSAPSSHSSASGDFSSDSFLVGLDVENENDATTPGLFAWRRLATPSHWFLNEYSQEDLVPQPLSLTLARKTAFTTLEQEEVEQLVQELTDLRYLAVHASCTGTINKAAQVLGMSPEEEEYVKILPSLTGIPLEVKSLEDSMDIFASQHNRANVMDTVLQRSRETMKYVVNT